MLPRALQCSSGTTKAFETPVLPQSVFPTRGRAQGSARLLGVLGVPPGPDALWRGRAALRPSPAPDGHCRMAAVCPQPWGDWGLRSPRAHWKAATGEIQFCRAVPSSPQQHPKSSPSGHSQELQAHLCLQLERVTGVLGELPWALPRQSTLGKRPGLGTGMEQQSPAPAASTPQTARARAHTVMKELPTAWPWQSTSSPLLLQNTAGELLIGFSKGTHLQQRRGSPPTGTSTSQDESASEHYVGTE